MSPNRLSTLAPCEQEAFLAPPPLVGSWLSAVGLLMKEHAEERVNFCSLKTLLQSKSPHLQKCYSTRRRDLKLLLVHRFSNVFSAGNQLLIQNIKYGC